MLWQQQQQQRFLRQQHFWWHNMQSWKYHRKHRWAAIFIKIFYPPSSLKMTSFPKSAGKNDVIFLNALLLGHAGSKSKSSFTCTMGTQISSTCCLLSALWSSKSLTFHSHSSFCTACRDSASWWWRSSRDSLIFSYLSSTSCSHDRNWRPL